MKKLNRILGLSLSAALMVGAMAGCAKPIEGTSTASPSASPSATTPAATGATPLVKTEDVIQLLVGIPRDTTVFTVDGVPVTAEQFYYWLGYTTDSIGYSSFGSADAIDWTQEQDGQTIGQYILENAKQTAQLYSLMESRATAEGLTLTAENQAEIDMQVSQTIEEMGSEESYAKWLQQIGMSDEGFRRMYAVSYLYNQMSDQLYGENSAVKPTAESMNAFAEEQSIYRTKHILISTKNDDGSAMEEAEATAAKEKAEGILAQLQAAAPAELETLFDTLMAEHSQDGRNADGTLSTPDGYVFGPGEMVAEFEEGTKALELGGLSGLVKTDYGYHIILRLSADSDELRSQWIDTQMTATVDGWMEASKVEDTDEMAKVDVQQFYTKLSTYRASLEPAPSETPAPSDSAAPSETPTPSATPAS